MILRERGPPGDEGFLFNLNRNMRAIRYALTFKEIYCLVIYFILDGFTTPSFGDYSYFFLMNVVGISKFLYAMLTLLGAVC